MKINKKLADAICAFWKLYDDDDISTPKLLEMCCQQFHLRDCCDVIDALKLGGLIEEQ